MNLEQRLFSVKPVVLAIERNIAVFQLMRLYLFADLKVIELGLQGGYFLHIQFNIVLVKLWLLFPVEPQLRILVYDRVNTLVSFSLIRDPRVSVSI